MGHLDPITGVPEFDRPIVDITGSMSAWQILTTVNHALKRAGYSHAAVEFRRVSEECEDDAGMLFTLALLFVRIPGQE